MQYIERFQCYKHFQKPLLQVEFGIDGSSYPYVICLCLYIYLAYIAKCVRKCRNNSTVCNTE